MYTSVANSTSSIYLPHDGDHTPLDAERVNRSPITNSINLNAYTAARLQNAKIDDDD